MPDFSVIQGGMAGKDRAVVRAQARAVDLFGRLIITVLRGVARGHDDGSTRNAFTALYEHISTTDGVTLQFIDSSLRETRGDELFEDLGELKEEAASVVLSALRVAAEALSSDGLTAARLSKRQDQLKSAIEEWLLSREERARANGWSALDDLRKRADRRYPRTSARTAPIKQASAPARRKPKAPPSQIDLNYIKSVGLPVERLLELVGSLDRPPSSLWHSNVASAVSQESKRKMTITEVGKQLLPTLRRLS